MAIKISYNGMDYLLEYDRDSITYLEKIGFSLQEYAQKPASMMPLLFRAAFYKNHKYAKQSEIDKMYGVLENKNELMNKLLSMVGESYDDLVNGNEGNLHWEEA